MSPWGSRASARGGHAALAKGGAPRETRPGRITGATPDLRPPPAGGAGGPWRGAGRGPRRDPPSKEMRARGCRPGAVLGGDAGRGALVPRRGRGASAGGRDRGGGEGPGVAGARGRRGAGRHPGRRRQRSELTGQRDRPDLAARRDRERADRLRQRGVPGRRAGPARRHRGPRRAPGGAQHDEQRQQPGGDPPPGRASPRRTSACHLKKTLPAGLRSPPHRPPTYTG